MNIRKWLLQPLHKELRHIMATLADIQAKSQAILDKATANTNALEAIKELVDGQKTQLTELKAELDAALATGNQEQIDEASANLDAGIDALDAQAAAEAAISGTPAAEPAPAPADGDTTEQPAPTE